MFEEYEDDRPPRRRSDDSILNKYSKELIKFAVAFLIAWFAVRERVSVLESKMDDLKERMTRLEDRLNRTANNGSGVPNVSIHP